MVKHTQTIRRQQPTNCLSVFDHFVGLALKGLSEPFKQKKLIVLVQKKVRSNPTETNPLHVKIIFPYTISLYNKVCQIVHSWTIANYLSLRFLIGIQTKAKILSYTSEDKSTYFGSCPHTVTGLNVVNDDWKKNILLTHSSSVLHLIYKRNFWFVLVPMWCFARICTICTI